MKVRLIVLICSLSLLLSGCSAVVNSEKDEIRRFDWFSEYDNGNTAELRFENSNAVFTVVNKEFTLDIAGLCSLSDDSILIFDSKDGMSYEFRYILHGDSVELNYRGDTLILEKKVEE